MRMVKIEGDRCTGKTTMFAAHIATTLKTNPEARVGVVTATSAQGRVVLDYLVDRMGVDNMDIKRVYLVTRNSNVQNGVNFDAVYIDNAEFVGWDTYASVAACLQPFKRDLPDRVLVYSIETGKTPLWETQVKEMELQGALDNIRNAYAGFPDIRFA